MSAYIVQVSYYEETYDVNGNVVSANPKQIIFGSIEDVRVSGANDLTTHPVANGTMVADHSIKQPVTMTITGKASTNGSNDVYVVGSQYSEKSFQRAIEQLKKEAWLCTITKWNTVLDRDKFLTRSNMVLTSFDWSEGINTLAFTLTFNEVFMVDVTSEVTKAADDDHIPALTEPIATSFSNQFVDWQQVGAMVCQSVEDLGLMSPEFKEILWAAASPELTGAAIAGGVALGASAVGGIAVAVYAACGATGPIGWIVGAAITTVAAVGFAAYFLSQAIKNAIKAANDAKKYKIAQFKAYKDDEKNRQEVERFTNFVGEVCLQIQELDKEFEVYQLVTTEQQEALVVLGNNNYIFRFVENSTIPKPRLRKNSARFIAMEETIMDVLDDEGYQRWTLTVYDQDMKIVCSNKKLSMAKTSFDQCSSTNPLFRTSGLGRYVFLCRTNAYNTDQNDLRNYAIVASKMKPEDFMERINATIRQSLVL